MKLKQGALALALAWATVGMAPALAQVDKGGVDKDADDDGGRIILPNQPRSTPRPTAAPRVAPNPMFGEWKRKAEAGDTEAMFQLAICYDEGRGVEKDDRIAAVWYAKAAEKGHRGAAFNLAIMFDEGEGMPEDNVQAVRYYEMAANAGEHKAAHNLAIMFKNGEAGLPADPFKAALWAGVAVKIGGTSSANLFRQLMDKLSPEDRAKVQAQVRSFGPATNL